MKIQIPYNWNPRWYQQEAWDYMTGGSVDPRASDNKHAELIWHRRAGKDEICLHFAAREMLMNPSTYWHMLPKANQVKKAIWLAVNPHTGKRRIKEAFPPEVFSYNEADMMVKCRANDATWQCLGSDNYDSAVGSPPRGITYSEWALANPSVRGYLRPIIAENKGWQLFITTPRGKNHAYQTFRAAQKNNYQFAQLLSIHDTGVLTTEQLLRELDEYVNTYGEAFGISLFEQEYECSFDAAILGSYYGPEIRDIRADGRVTDVGFDHKYPVHVVMDIGFDDDTAIWWFQVIAGELRILEYYANSGKDPDHYISQIKGRFTEIQLNRDSINVFEGGLVHGLDHRRDYNYGTIWLPHDAKAKTFAAKGKTIQEQFSKAFGWGKVKIVPSLSIEDGIQAVRKALHRSYFDDSCEPGLAALEQYQREWDNEKQMFKDKPLHDWTSHAADAFRYLAIAWAHERPEEIKREIDYSDLHSNQTFKQMLDANRKRRLADG